MFFAEFNIKFHSHEIQLHIKHKECQLIYMFI